MIKLLSSSSSSSHAVSQEGVARKCVCVYYWCVCVFITGEGESQNKGKQIWSFLSGDEHAATEDSSPSMGGGKYLLACRIKRVGVLYKPQRARSTWGLETRAGSTRQQVGRAS